MTELEENIKTSVIFHSIAATGFHTLKCPVCNDTRIRAGFVFESDRVVYNCFRGKCDASGEYVYGQYMSRKFRQLMRTLDVEIPVEVRLNNKKQVQHEYDKSLYEQHSYKAIELPEDVVEYDPYKHYWFEEMLSDRCVDFNRKLYVGTDKEWEHKLIVPFYHLNKLIGWQGVSYFSSTKSTRYLTSSGNTDIIYINNDIGRIIKRPIIVEGIMDASVFGDSIAILGNHVSKKQAYMLRCSSPILIPDRKDSNFLKAAKKYGWDISIPKWKEKDLNAAVQNHGKLVTAKMIYDGITNNITKAEVKYNLWRTK
jgi:hypothetical protein